MEKEKVAEIKLADGSLFRLSDCETEEEEKLLVPEFIPEWLVPGFIPKGEITLLVGNEDSGEKVVTHRLAAAVSSGGSVFFDASTKLTPHAPQKVLLIDNNKSPVFYSKRMLKEAGANLANIFFVDFRCCAFTQDELLSTIEKLRPALVIMDSIINFVPFEFFSSPSDSSKVYRGAKDCFRNVYDFLSPLLERGRKLGTAFLVVAPNDDQKLLDPRIWYFLKSFAKSILETGIDEGGIFERRKPGYCDYYLKLKESYFVNSGATILFDSNGNRVG